MSKSIAAERHVVARIAEARENSGSEVAMFVTEMPGFARRLKIQSGFGFCRPLSRRIQKQTGLDILQDDLHRLK